MCLDCSARNISDGWMLPAGASYKTRNRALFCLLLAHFDFSQFAVFLGCLYLCLRRTIKQRNAYANLETEEIASANLERSMLYGFQLEMTHWVRKDKDKLEQNLSWLP